MIISFACKETEKIWHGVQSRIFPLDIQARALTKLSLIDAANSFKDLQALPGNRPEALKGNRSGQISIRVNNQWRICFLFNNGDASHVRIIDYH